MFPEIKLIISQNDKVIQTVTKEVEDTNIIKSLTEFQTAANTALTKMIDELGVTGGDSYSDEENDGSDSEDQQTSPKRKKT